MSRRERARPLEVVQWGSDLETRLQYHRLNQVKFKQASIWARTVVISSKLNFTVPTIFLKWVIALLTAAYQMSPKWGERSGICFHIIFWKEQNWVIVCWDCWHWRNSDNSFNSLEAPVKLVPWSLQIIDDLPRRATNRWRVAINASVVKLETNSKWTALTAKHTNKPMYTFTNMGFRVAPNLTKIGPA